MHMSSRISPLVMGLTLMVLPFTFASAKPSPVKSAPKAAAKAGKQAQKAVQGSAAKKAVSAKDNVRQIKKGGKVQAEPPVAKNKVKGKVAAKAEPVAKAPAKAGKKGRQQAVAKSEPKMRMTTLKVGGRNIQVEVASTAAEQERGLMYRKSLAADGGMLFDFQGPAKTCMWMKDTYIPLSVAFIDAKGKVVNIEEMKPKTTTSHCSKDWIRYALEMNAKWFSRHGVKPGSRVSGLPR